MNRPWMPLYIAEYLADTGHLSAAEHGAYMLLIMHYWQKDGLPNDERQLARIARLSPDEWRDSRDTLRAFFGDNWRHKRIDDEIAHAEDIIGKRKAAAEQRHSIRNANAPPKARANAEQKQTHARVDVNVIVESSKEEAPRARVEPESANRYDALTARLSEVAAPMACATNADISPIVRLIDNGFSLEGHILPVVRDLRRKRAPANTWAYVAKAVAGRANDQGAIPKIQPKTEPDYENDPTWLGLMRLALTEWRGGKGAWSQKGIGPPPGEPGCKVPDALLAEFGLKKRAA